MASSGVTHVLTDCFAQNCPSGLENSCGNGCIAVRYKAFDEVGSQQHWDALQRDVVFQRESFAGELAFVRDLVRDGAFPRPSAMRVLSSVRKMYILAWESIFIHSWYIVFIIISFRWSVSRRGCSSLTVKLHQLLTSIVVDGK